MEWVVWAADFLGDPKDRVVAVVTPLSPHGWRYEVEVVATPPRGWAARRQPSYPGQLHHPGRHRVDTGWRGVLAYLERQIARLQAAQAAAALYPDPRG